ncbi:MAG TPA: acetoin utilization protein AcuC [Steroidobacteraceae bacterium]
MQQAHEVVVVAGERLARYGFGDGHPFGTDRHAAFMREFDSRGLNQRVQVVPPRAASLEELLLFHTREYVDLVRERSLSGQGYLDAGDTPAYRGMFEAASDVVGGTLLAVESIMSGAARRAFVPIAGLHHASRGHAAGFCVFNDCGVAIEVLRSRFGLARIAYVDIDAHHGDGVFYAFEDDPLLVFADMHEDGRFLYPGTGAASETGRGKAAGMSLNIPLAPGADDAVFRREWPRVLAHVEAHRPDFIILQCGVDSMEGDPITHLHFSPDVHRSVARDLRALAQRLGHGRLLATGGGGYNRANIASGWTAVVESLAD